MPAGKINYYNWDRGFGFIIPDGKTRSEKIMFHISHYNGDPVVGSMVRYNENLRDKLPERVMAVDVRPLVPDDVAEFVPPAFLRR